MQNHVEIFGALLAGFTLTNGRGTISLNEARMMVGDGGYPFTGNIFDPKEWEIKGAPNEELEDEPDDESPKQMTITVNGEEFNVFNSDYDIGFITNSKLPGSPHILDCVSEARVQRFGFLKFNETIYSITPHSYHELRKA